MSSFTPKLLYSRSQGRQIPVWEVCDGKGGERVYFERYHKKGMIPVGYLDVYQMDGSTVVVCDVVKDNGTKQPKINYDGFHAPNSWYEKDPFYTEYEDEGSDDDNEDEQPERVYTTQVAEEDLADLVDLIEVDV